MRVSVVICTHSADLVEHFQDAADSVLSQTYDDVELVVVVDGDVDLCEQVNAEYGDVDAVTVHCHQPNRGLSASRNAGVERATGDVVAFMDDDAVASPDWVATLVETYRETDALAVGGRMEPRWLAGRPRLLPPEFYWLIGVTHEGFPDERGEVRNTFGSNISFRRDVLETLGGFSTEVGLTADRALQGEEAELAARMRVEYGRGVVYEPDAVVAHKIFSYRSQPGWLLARAFWQGYSKRAMDVITPDSGGEEGEFLRYLVVESVPSRLRRVAGGSAVAAGQLAALVVLSAAVGAGYLYGTVRWPPGADGR